jgi:hypothetical protein
MILTPLFMGSEPTTAETGKYAGTRVFEAEEQNGLAEDLPNEVFTAAFRDNFELQYAGICYGELTNAQQALLRRVLDTYIGRLRHGNDYGMDLLRQHRQQFDHSRL